MVKLRSKKETKGLKLELKMETNASKLEPKKETNNEKPKRGAPKGNQNARTHGFYSKVLDETEQMEFEQATEVEGLDEEIALLRVKIKSLMLHQPENLPLIMRAVRTLERLLRTKYNIKQDDKQSMRSAIGNVLREIALPIGVSIGSALRKG